MPKEFSEDDAMEGRTFSCPHCGFVLQKKWRQERCPWCQQQIPPNTEKWVENKRVERATKSNVHPPRKEKTEIYPIQEISPNQMGGETKKISPKLQDILAQPIEKFKEIQASEKFYDPTPQEQSDFVSQWSFDPIENKILLAGGYFYTGESVHLHNSKWKEGTICARPYVYIYPSPFGEEK